jgi:Contractile injection system tube protein
MSNFQHPKQGQPGVISIASADTGIQVDAQYNPKELQIDKSVPWQKNPQSNKSPEKGIQLEFTGAEGRTMQIELMFDGVEQKKSVAKPITDLNTMASPLDPGSTDENKRRPHRCLVTWGSTVPSFRCVIESLSVKYTMFSEDGVPLRATCTVKVKEADVVAMAKSDGK